MLAQLFGCFDGAFHAVFPAGELYVCAVSLHQGAALDAHRLGHGKNEWVAFYGCDESQPDACVAAGGLDDCGTGLELPCSLGFFDHGTGDAVFHAAAGIEKLYFGDDGACCSAER